MSARSLRICMVTTFYPPYSFGGDALSVRRLCAALARRGHRVTVVHDMDAYRVLSGHPEPPPEAGIDGVEVVALESAARGLSPLLTHQTGRPVVHGRRIRRILERGEFDVVNFHNVSLIGGPGILAAGDALKLYTAREHWLVCPTHALFRHRREPCEERQCIRCSLHYRRPPQLWRYTGYLERQLHHVDAFIALTEFSRAKHRELGFPREMEVVPNLLSDDEGDGAADAGPPHDRPYFFCAGRLERLKGLDDVIPLFRDPDGETDLLVAGRGDHEPGLRRLAGDSPRVRFLGRLATEELRPYYRHAIAHVLPSRTYETFGITALEAFREGTPVIARRIGPFPEVVEDSGGGLLFDDAEELRSAMRRVALDPALRAALGQSGARGYRERWSEQAIVPRYLDVIGGAALKSGRDELAARVGPP